MIPIFGGVINRIHTMTLLTSGEFKEITEENGVNLELKCLKKPISLKLKGPPIIAKGNNGTIYKVSSKRAVKIVPVTNRLGQSGSIKKQILDEFQISKQAGMLGVGPKTYETYICCNTSPSAENACYYLLYMDYLDGVTLREWLKKPHSKTETDKVHTILKKKLEILHNNHIIHYNLHNENILVIGKKKITDVIILDYGTARTAKRIINKEKKSDLRQIEYAMHSQKMANAGVVVYVLSRMIEEKNADLRLTK
jgi:serine/threonine protein kinase